MSDTTAFDSFMVKVDDACYDICGMSVHDLPDFDFWTAFKIDGWSAVKTAKKAIKNAGGDFC